MRSFISRSEINSSRLEWKCVVSDSVWIKWISRYHTLLQQKCGQFTDLLPESFAVFVEEATASTSPTQRISKGPGAVSLLLRQACLHRGNGLLTLTCHDQTNLQGFQCPPQLFFCQLSLPSLFRAKCTTLSCFSGSWTFSTGTCLELR